MFTRVPIRVLLLLNILAIGPFLLHGVSASPSPSQNTKAYLPLVSRPVPPLPPIEVVQHRSIGDPPLSEDYVSGYVKNLTSTPLYSVTLAMNVHVTNCFDADPCEERDFTERVTPAFGVTLPNQPNPFQTSSYLQFKASYRLGDVVAVNVLRNPPNTVIHEALTVSQIQRGESHPYPVEGVVRNDGNSVLQGVRVVVYVPDAACYSRDATVDATTLAPGQETTFHVDSYCGDGTIAAVGQGVVAE